MANACIVFSEDQASIVITIVLVKEGGYVANILTDSGGILSTYGTFFVKILEVTRSPHETK